MGTEQQTFTGDASQLVAEYDKLEARARKLEEAQKKGAKTASDGNKQLAKEMKDLQREAEATTKSVMTPTEKYQAQLAKLNQQRAAGAISEETYSRAVKKTERELRGATRAQEDVFSVGLANLTKMAAGWLSVSAAINVASAAHREKLRIERETSDKQISLGASEAIIEQNLVGGGLSNAQIDAFHKKVGGIQARTKFGSRATLNLAAAEAFSGSLGNEQATLSALEAAAQITRLTPDQLPTISGAALDIGKASGSADAKRNIGFLLSAGGLARISSLDAQARNIAPAIQSAVGTVSDPDRGRASVEAGALFATLNAAASDTRGESTRTATQSFAIELEKFFREGYAEGTGKGKRTITPLDPGTLAGRIESLQADAGLRGKFLATATPGEKNFQVAIRSLLENETKTITNVEGKQVDINAADVFRQGQRVISFDPKIFERAAGRIGASTENQQRASAAASFSEIRERLQADNSISGRTDVVRQGLSGILDQTSPGYFGYANRRLSAADLEQSFATDPNNPELAGIRKARQEYERLGSGSVFQIAPRDKLSPLSSDPETARQQTALLDAIKELRLAAEAARDMNQNAGQAAAVAERKTHLEN